MELRSLSYEFYAQLLVIFEGDGSYDVYFLIIGVVFFVTQLIGDELGVAVDEELFVEQGIEALGNGELLEGFLLVVHLVEQEEGVGDAELDGLLEPGLRDRGYFLTPSE
jgi:hypothetical protein